MNILYIGPYRQSDYIGQVSSLHIKSISEKISKPDRLVTRPIYMDPGLADTTNITKYDHEIIKDLDNIDILVQYLPLECMAINTTSKMVSIPILDAKIHNISQNLQYKTLNYFDKILVDDDKQKQILKTAGVSASIECYEEKITDSKKQKFDTNLLDNTYKFGFIGPYKNNQQILEKIIASFLHCYRGSYTASLILFMRGSDGEKAELDKTIEKIKQDLKIPEYISNIATIFGMWDRDESITALNSINCLISLNNDIRYWLYEKYLLSDQTPENKKFVISRSNTNTIETSVMPVGNPYEYKDTLTTISVCDLSKKMLMATDSVIQKQKKTDHPSLGDIICKIRA